MSEYKFVYHGNEIPFSEIEFHEFFRPNNSNYLTGSENVMVTIRVEWEKAVNYALSKVISEIISNNLQV